MLAGLIRDDERTVADGDSRAERPPADRPAVRAQPQAKRSETDIILTLTPHIVRVLDLTEDGSAAVPCRRRDGANPVRGCRFMPPMPIRGATAAAAAAHGSSRRRCRRAPDAGDADPACPRRRGSAPGRPARRCLGRPRHRYAAPLSVTRIAVTLRPPFRRGAPEQPYQPTVLARLSAPSAQQPLDQLAVAALDRLERRDPALAFGGQAGGDQRHPRSQIPAVERAAAAQPRRPGDDDAVRVGEEQSAPMPLICSSANSRSSYIQSCTSVRPVGLRRQHGHQAHQVARERRPQAGGDAATALRLATASPRTRRRACRTRRSSASARRRRPRCPRSRAPFDRDLAAGDRADHRPAAGLDVVAAEPCSAPRSRVHAFDANRSSCRRRTRRRPSSCRNSHSSTTCGSVAAWRISVTPGARGRGQQRRLGAGDRRLVEIHRGAGFRPSGASST